MIHVKGRKRQLSCGPALMQQIEQDHGIHAATERDGDMRSAYGVRIQHTVDDCRKFLIHDYWESKYDNRACAGYRQE
jgi:hypothetical protein